MGQKQTGITESKESYKVVVGIDFGSSGCGFAYSFMNKDKIYHCDIPGADVDKKVPTEIILDNNNNVLEFGAKCKEYLRRKGLNSGHYFKGIKMKLYEKKTTITSINTNKKLPLVLVIEKVLETLINLCVDKLNQSWNFFEESNIKWVVTVPAIWGDFEKGIMMEACINLGLIDEDDDKSLFFALEPEAASLYCSKNDSIRKELIEKGKYYIICDLGGGTGDIVTHLVGNNCYLEEISKPCGGGYGSNEIDKKIFKRIIYELFGYEDFNSLKKKYDELKIRENENVIYDSWCNLERDIKEFKEGSNLEKINKKEKYPICCDVFKLLFENAHSDINVLVDKYNNNLTDNDLKLNVISSNRWMIEFPYRIINNYIDEQANSICDEIRNILSKSQKDIDKIMLVGGYCSNEVIVSKIQQKLGGNFYYILPPNPYLAIIEGAVLFGLNPSIIQIRIAKYTIGIETRNKWNDSIHSKMGKKAFDEEHKVWRCENCFSKLIEVDQKLKYNESIGPFLFKMIGPRKGPLNFYKSLNPNPIFTSEKGVEKILVRELDAKKDYPVGERDVKIYMKFGGTYIDVKAIHEKSGEFIKINLNYN